MNRLVTATEAVGVDLRCDADVKEIVSAGRAGGFEVVVSQGGARSIVSVREAILVATGRSGARWTTDLFGALGVELAQRDVLDIGVRVETDSRALASVWGHLGDPKLVLSAATPEEVRTLCWCRGGEVCVVRHHGLQVVDGCFGSTLGPRTSLSLVARVAVPQGFAPLEYLLATLDSHAHGGRPFAQRLSSWVGQRRVKGHARPRIAAEESDKGNVVFSQLKERILVLLEMIDYEAGGALIGSESSLVFGPVVDKTWSTPRLDRDLMTSVPNVFAIGDATGMGRGVVQALFSGLAAARAIVSKDDRTSARLAVQDLPLSRYLE